jgi:hypothetical protein
MNGVEWNTMELIPSHTIQSFNFSYHPIWGVCNGMEHYNLNITNITLLLFTIYSIFQVKILHCIILLLHISCFVGLTSKYLINIFVYIFSFLAQTCFYFAMLILFFVKLWFIYFTNEILLCIFYCVCFCLVNF